MKWIVRCLLMSWLLAGCTLALPTRTQAEDWLNPPPARTESANDEAIAPADYYEVVASKQFAAEVRLAEQSIIQLTPDEARTYTGAYFAVATGKTPYLVRALYGHGATGGYTLSRQGNDLLIVHQSLGRNTVYNRSAFVVNLSFAPKTVYLSVSIAE